MLGMVAEFILSFLGDLASQIVGELVLGTGVEAVSRAWRRPSRRLELIELVILILLGAGLGALSGVFVPKRILPVPPVPALSLVITPVIAGLIMMRYGQYRRLKGKEREVVATFWGGALCALAIALGRFWMVCL